LLFATIYCTPTIALTRSDRFGGIPTAIDCALLAILLPQIGFDPSVKFRFKTQWFAIDAILSILLPTKVEKSGNIEIKWGG